MHKLGRIVSDSDWRMRQASPKGWIANGACHMTNSTGSQVGEFPSRLEKWHEILTLQGIYSESIDNLIGKPINLVIGIRNEYS